VTRRILFSFLLLLCAARASARFTESPCAEPVALVADTVAFALDGSCGDVGRGLRASLEDVVPKTGEGQLLLLGSERAYHWTRQPLDVTFSAGANRRQDRR